MNGLGVAERAALGDLDRIDVTDQVTDAGVRGGELLAVPFAGVPPGDGELITEFGGEPAAPRAAR